MVGRMPRDRCSIAPSLGVKSDTPDHEYRGGTTRMRLYPSILIVLMLVGCGGNSNSSVTSPSSSVPCGAVRNPGTGDPNEPVDDVAIATTVDGLTLSDTHVVLTHASVPDGTLLPDGGIGIYYLNQANGGMEVARLSGGVVTPVGPISIDGINHFFGADPDAELVNGRVRLTYNQVLAGTGTASRHFCVAESSDGLNFQTLGTALTISPNGPSYSDPSVAQLANGSFLMGYSQTVNTVLARSSDGVSFSSTGSVLSYGGVPEVTTLDDGRVRLYVCASSNIDAYISSDSGGSWQRERTVVTSASVGGGFVCDPSMVRGTNVFIFKMR
jgi:hypothetical protein